LERQRRGDLHAHPQRWNRDDSGIRGGDVTANVQAYIASVNTMATPPAGQKVLADSATGTFANGAGACSAPALRFLMTGHSDKRANSASRESS